jgi:hypothetical protein
MEGEERIAREWLGRQDVTNFYFHSLVRVDLRITETYHFGMFWGVGDSGSCVRDFTS